MQGQTPLHYAAKHDAVNMVHVLISKLADVNAQDREVRPLCLCASRLKSSDSLLQAQDLLYKQQLKPSGKPLQALLDLQASPIAV